MPSPGDPLGLGDLPYEQPVQGGYGTQTPVAPSPVEQDREAYAWTQATRSVPPAAYEDRNAYWAAKRQIARDREAQARQERIRKQQQDALQREVDRASARNRQLLAYNRDNPALREGIVRAVEGAIPQAVGVGEQMLGQQMQQRQQTIAQFRQQYPDITPDQNPERFPERNPPPGSNLDQAQQEQMQLFGRLLTPEEEVRVGFRKPGGGQVPLNVFNLPFDIAGRALTPIGRSVGGTIGSQLGAPDVGAAVGGFAAGAAPYAVGAAVAPELLVAGGITGVAETQLQAATGEISEPQAALGTAMFAGEALVGGRRPPNLAPGVRPRIPVEIDEALAAGVTPKIRVTVDNLPFDVAIGADGTLTPSPTMWTKVKLAEQRFQNEKAYTGQNGFQVVAGRLKTFLGGRFAEERGAAPLIPAEEPLRLIAAASDDLAKFAETSTGKAALAALSSIRIPVTTPPPMSIEDVLKSRRNRELTVPAQFNNPVALARTRQRLENHALANADIAGSYEDYGQAILDAVGGNREAAARVIGATSILKGDAPLAVRAVEAWASGGDFGRLLRRANVPSGRIPIVKAFLDNPTNHSSTRSPQVAGPLRQAHPTMWAASTSTAPIPDVAIRRAFGLPTDPLALTFAQNLWVASEMDGIAERLNQRAQATGGRGGWTGERVAAALSAPRRMSQRLITGSDIAMDDLTHLLSSAELQRTGRTIYQNVRPMPQGNEFNQTPLADLLQNVRYSYEVGDVDRAVQDGLDLGAPYIRPRQRLSAMVQSAQHIEGTTAYVYNDTDHFQFPQSDIAELASEEFMQLAAKAFESAFNDAIDAISRLEIPSNLAAELGARGINLEFQPTRFGGFNLTGDVQGENFGFGNSEAFAAGDQWMSAPFRDRNIQFNIFELVQEKMRPWVAGMSSANMSHLMLLQEFTDFMDQVALHIWYSIGHELAHSYVSPGFREERIPNHGPDFINAAAAIRRETEVGTPAYNAAWTPLRDFVHDLLQGEAFWAQMGTYQQINEQARETLQDIQENRGDYEDEVELVEDTYDVTEERDPRYLPEVAGVPFRPGQFFELDSSGSAARSLWPESAGERGGITGVAGVQSSADIPPGIAIARPANERELARSKLAQLPAIRPDSELAPIGKADTPIAFGTSDTGVNFLSSFKPTKFISYGRDSLAEFLLGPADAPTHWTKIQQYSDVISVDFARHSEEFSHTSYGRQPGGSIKDLVQMLHFLMDLQASNPYHAITAVAADDRLHKAYTRLVFDTEGPRGLNFNLNRGKALFLRFGRGSMAQMRGESLEDLLRELDATLPTQGAVSQRMARTPPSRNGPPGTPPQTPGAQPNDPVQTLIDAVTTEDVKKASYMEGVMRNLRNIREYFSATERTERETGARVKEGARNIVVRYAGLIQSSIPRETGIETRELQRQMGDATEEQLRRITGALDDYPQDIRDRFLDGLTMEQKIIYGVLRQRVDAMGDLLEARGIISAEDRRENYFTHMIDMINEGIRAGTSGGGLRTPIVRPRRAIITGHRTYDTITDAIEAGNQPLTLNPFKIYEHFVNEAKIRMAMADMIDDIRTFDPEGVVYLRPGEEAPPGFKTVKHPMFEGMLAVQSGDRAIIIRHRWAVRDSVASYIKALVEPSAVRGHPVGKALLLGTATIKRTVLGGPLDFNFLGFEMKDVGYTVGSDVRKFMVGALHTGMMSDEAFDHYLLQEVNYAGQKMTRADMFKRLDLAGLTGGGWRTDISRMMGGDEPVTTLIGYIPFIGKWYEKAQTATEKAQFDRMIPMLKYNGAAVLVEHKLKTGRGKAMSLPDVEREAALDMNTAMGGINRVRQGRSKTSQDLMSVLAIAPDWAESRLALSAGAFMPGANNATNRRHMARWMVAGAIATVVGSWAYGEERGWDDEQRLKYISENLSPVKIVNGKPRINGHFMEYQMNGSGQWTSLLSWEKDAWKLLFGMYALATGDRGGFDLTAGGYATSRAGTLPKLAIDAIFQKNYSGQPISKNTGWSGFRDWLAYEATQAGVPSFGSALLGAQVPGYPGGEQTLQGALQNISGFGRARTISATDTINRAVQDEHIPKYDREGKQAGEYMTYIELPNDIKGEFDKRHPEEVQDVKDAREARGRDTFDLLRTRTQEGLAELAPLWQTDKQKYREQVSDLVSKRAAITQETIDNLKKEGIEFSERKGDLGLLDRYFEAVRPATNPKTFVTDFDQRDTLEEDFRNGLTDHERQRLDEMLVYTTDPTYQELKKDKKYIADSGYFDRVDKAWGEFHKELLQGTGDPQFDAVIPDWQSPEDMQAYLKQRIQEEGQPETYWDRIPIQGAWENYLEGQTAVLVNGDPKLDVLLIELGYQRRPKSQEAYDQLVPTPVR